MKKIMLSMAVLAAMCVGGYFGYSAYQESKLTDLELANVEALSNDEAVQIPCIKYPTGTCTFTVTFVSGEVRRMTIPEYINYN